MITCKRIIIDNSPCNCVTAETVMGNYIDGGATLPASAKINSLNFAKYDDAIVVYKQTSTGWIEVQNYTFAGADTDTRIRFVQVLPSGEWKWEVINVLDNTVLSTFNTPPVSTQIHSYEVQNVPYTGVELPTTPGTNIGDTKSVQFDGGTVGNYTWDGSVWGLDFVENWAEKRICLNTATPLFTPLDPNNPTIAEVESWKNANMSLHDQTNGTQLVYFVPGDGGSCDDPDFTWTLNKGSELITLSNKRVFNTKTVYVDAGSGSDVTGKRGYREFPFKTLNAAMLAYQDNDWLEYHSSNETINTSINYDTNLTTNIDFSNSLVNLNAPLLSNGFTSLNPKTINIISNYKIIANSAGFFNAMGENSDVSIDINEYTTPRTFGSSRGNYVLKANTITRTGGNRMSWFSGSNKNVHINVKNLRINHNLSLGQYDAGCFNLEAVSGLHTINTNMTVQIDNVFQNSLVGTIADIGCGSGGYIYDSNFNIYVKNMTQQSSFTNYPYFPSVVQRTSNIELFRSSYPNPEFNNMNYNIVFDNVISDLSFDAEYGLRVTLNNVRVNAVCKNCLCKKLPSIIYAVSKQINNSNIQYSGNFTNTSDREIIRLDNVNLVNSTFVFDGNYKNNVGVFLSNIILDSNSKIVFRGKYELGNGFFDISGVTGAGADNIYFEDCTIITNNSECIVSTTPKNIKILNVRSNKLLNSNITELIQSTTVNSLIN